MLTKYAFFTGTVKNGKKDDMRKHVQSVLQPLWEQFQPSISVTVLYEYESEPGSPSIPLVLAVTYANRKSLDQAMQSQARHDARKLLPEFYDRFFDHVELWHCTFSH